MKRQFYDLTKPEPAELVGMVSDLEQAVEDVFALVLALYMRAGGKVPV